MSEPKRVSLSLEFRPDGGLRVYSDNVPGLILSGVDPDAVMSDVLPVLRELWPDLFVATEEPTP